MSLSSVSYTHLDVYKRQLFALVSVLNIPDETQITIRYLFCVLGLHDAVIDPEYLGDVYKRQI